MDPEIKVNACTAETVYINHPEASYGTFCFNSIGDLFVNSDWGFYGYAWRSYGKSFKEFLSACSAEYIVGKFAIEYRSVTGKKFPKHKEDMMLILVSAFVNHLKTQAV